MVASIADKLTAMTRERDAVNRDAVNRDAVNNGTRRDLVILKASGVDAELEKLDFEAADAAPRNADGVADGLRSRRDRGRIAGDQSRNSRDLSFTDRLDP